jgi:hypothetical protein
VAAIVALLGVLALPVSGLACEYACASDDQPCAEMAAEGACHGDTAMPAAAAVTVSCSDCCPTPLSHAIPALPKSQITLVFAALPATTISIAGPDLTRTPVLQILSTHHPPGASRSLALRV